MTIWVALALFAGLPAVTLGLTAFNLAVWPRGETDSRSSTADGEAISVLVPARDEEATIERCIRSIVGSDLELGEVIVYDDGSTDRTPEILADLSDEFDRLRVLESRPLPDGWVGKPHACHQLANAASGDVLVFLDADTAVEPGGLERLLSLLDGQSDDGPDLVSAVPRQLTPSLPEALVVPLLHLTYTSWLPLPLIWRTSDPRFLAANGQVLAVRTEALADVGGFETVRADVVDDMALCRALKRAGHRVVFADGFRIARCRMYESWSELWEGFSKNLYEGIGGNLFALAVVVLIYSVAFLLPWVGLPAGWWAGSDVVVIGALVGVGCNVLQRTLLAVRFDHPALSVLLHPVGLLAVLAIAVNSCLWHSRGEVQWAGRTYGARSER